MKAGERVKLGVDYALDPDGRANWASGFAKVRLTETKPYTRQQAESRIAAGQVGQVAIQGGIPRRQADVGYFVVLPDGEGMPTWYPRHSIRSTWTEFERTRDAIAQRQATQEQARLKAEADKRRRFREAVQTVVSRLNNAHMVPGQEGRALTDADSLIAELEHAGLRVTLA